MTGINLSVCGQAAGEISRAIRLENENSVKNLVVLHCHISIASRVRISISDVSMSVFVT